MYHIVVAGLRDLHDIYNEAEDSARNPRRDPHARAAPSVPPAGQEATGLLAVHSVRVPVVEQARIGQIDVIRLHWTHVSHSATQQGRSTTRRRQILNKNLN